MTYQIRSFMIDGINLDERIVNWKDKVFFGRHKMHPENISFGHTLFEKINDVYDGQPIEDFAKIWSEEDAKGLWPILIFFACYHLANPKKQMPKISKFFSSAVERIDFQKDVAETFGHMGSIRPGTESRRNKMTNDESFECMSATLPLFDKIMKNQTREFSMSPLIIALLLYQRAMEEEDHLKDFLDLVIILEAMFNDGTGEITFKIRQRTSNFCGETYEERKEIFEKIKEAYNARSKLVHGGDLTLDRYGEYHTYKTYLIPIVQKCLLRFIDEYDKGKTKNQINQELDDLALSSS
ncbi:MAG: hypothetical protein KGZ34_06555 [Nitrosarchaeum sp.]|nr:hypothetical protein [Nitrosarchaeum sp.]